MSEKEYLVIYFPVFENLEPKMRRVQYSDLWKILDEAKQEEMLISVYELGPCLLDWS